MYQCDFYSNHNPGIFQQTTVGLQASGPKSAGAVCSDASYKEPQISKPWLASGWPIRVFSHERCWLAKSMMFLLKMAILGNTMEYRIFGQTNRIQQRKLPNSSYVSYMQTHMFGKLLVAPWIPIAPQLPPSHQRKYTRINIHAYTAYAYKVTQSLIIVNSTWQLIGQVR